MKIAILTSGILPIPAVQGGAVENLIDFYLDYNNKHKLHRICVYSVSHPTLSNYHASPSTVNSYYYINVHTWGARIKRKCFSIIHKNGYYNYFIEYFLNQCLKHIRKQNYDIIIMENRPAYALRLQKITKAELICHLHNELLTSKTILAKEIYNSLSKIITVSNYISNTVNSIMSNDNKCITVYNGIDLDAFTSIQLNSKINRISLGINADDFLLIFCGRINPEKGIMELTTAMTLLNDYPQIKLLIIGGSFFGNETNDNSFVKKLKDGVLRIRDRIIFTGYIQYNLIPSYLKLADVAIVPSIWNDPFPTTVIEAQAAGLPIIATRRGGIPEEVTADNALLLDIQDDFIHHLAESILFLYNHPEERKKMSAASLSHSARFAKQRFAKDFFMALEQ